VIREKKEEKNVSYVTVAGKKNHTNECKKKKEKKSRREYI
jgi:hypothetical protein